MGVRILRVPKFCVNIKLLYLDPTYFRLYVRLTATEKYTIASLICRKLYLRVFDFLTFILQEPHFCKHYTLGLSKIGIFLYFRVRGKAQHPDPPSHFIGSPLPLGSNCIDNFRSMIGCPS